MGQMIDHPVVVGVSAISLPVLVVGAVRLHRGTGGDLAVRLLYRNRRVKSGYGTRAALVVGLISVIAVWVVVADLWDWSMLPPLATLIVAPMVLHRMTEDMSDQRSGHDTTDNISGPEFQSPYGVFRAVSSDRYGFGALTVILAVAAIFTVFFSVVAGAVLGAAALVIGVKALKAAREEARVTPEGIEMRTWRYRLSVPWDDIVAFDPAAVRPSSFPSVGRRFAEWFHRSRGMPLAEVVETSDGDRFRLNTWLRHERSKVPFAHAVYEVLMPRLLGQAHARLHAGEHLSFGRLSLDRVGLTLDGVKLGPEVEVDLLGGWLLVWDGRQLLYRERWHRVRNPYVLVAFEADRRRVHSVKQGPPGPPKPKSRGKRRGRSKPTPPGPARRR